MYGANQFFLVRGNKRLLPSFPFRSNRSIFPPFVRSYFHYFGSIVCKKISYASIVEKKGSRMIR